VPLFLHFGLARHGPKIFWALLARTRLTRSTMGLDRSGPARPNSQHYAEATDSRSCHEQRGRSLESCFLATSHSSPRACGAAAGGGRVRPGDGRGDRRGGAPRPLHHRRRGGGAEAAGPPLASQENTPTEAPPTRSAGATQCRRDGRG
jgi:hypothetical protein